MSDTDYKKLNRLFATRIPCVAVQTYEAEYVLDLARRVAQENGWDLWIWSVIGGLRDGLITVPAIPETDHPAALMYHLAERIRSRTGERTAIYAILDIAGHLEDDRTLRALREA